MFACAPALITAPSRVQSHSHRAPQFRRMTVVRAESSPAAGQAESDPTVCKTCGAKLAEAPKGCDGQGRVAGGMGAFVDWWPIKAYRECPALTASGRSYSRKGQITDEMLFGRNEGGKTKF